MPYIVFDGPDKSGKSTQAKLLADSLVEQGREVVLTKEPGSPWVPVAAQLREMVLTQNLHATSRFLLFLCDRNEHMKNVVEPALSAGKYVISDRSYLSGVSYYVAEKMAERNAKTCYEVCGGEYDLAISMLNLVQTCMPDIAFISSLNEDQFLSTSQKDLDIIEQRGVTFQQNVQQILFEIIDRQLSIDYLPFPQRIVELPKTHERSISEMAALILEATEVLHA